MSQSATKSAERILELTWSADRFPVDPVTIARKLGLDVLETELPDEVSGALIKEAGKDPIIIVHRQDSNNRKRFSCAHELGHYISRVESKDADHSYEYVDLRSPSASNGNNPEEIFANQFAAALLMPSHIVKTMAASNKSHIEMAAYFGVSNESMKFRLTNLGLL